jgi:hypothetical protein
VNFIGGDRAIGVANFPPPLMADHREIRFAFRRRIGDVHRPHRQDKKENEHQNERQRPTDFQFLVARHLARLNLRVPLAKIQNTPND